MSWIARFKRQGPNGFGYASVAQEVTEGLDLSGKTYLLTGCSAGLGLETWRVLTQRGAHVIATARNRDKALGAAREVEIADPFVLTCDLSEPVSIAQCVAKVREHGHVLDAIIANAGIMALPKLEQKHGYELQFFTNHIGHFLLVTQLLEALSERARVVVVSSDAHRRSPRGGIQFDNLSGERGYHPWLAYGQSKLANLLFAKQLAKRFEGSNRTANAVHPGVIATDLHQHLPELARRVMSGLQPLLLKDVEQGAATQCFAATHPSAEHLNGVYLKDCRVAKPSRKAEDAELAARLWEVSEEIAEQLQRSASLAA